MLHASNPIQLCRESLQYQYERIPRVRSSWPKLTFETQNEFRKLERIEYLRRKSNEDVIGSDTGFWGPFGWRKYTYCDHTASGKAVKCIESFIEKQVLPHYANTHTTVSHTSMQTTIFRNEARSIIRQSVGALDNDEVIFCGSGATSAVHKLLHSISYPKTRKLIAFIGPFEHHSNILPWREAASKIIQVPMNSSTGQVDMLFLRQSLKKWTDKNKKEKNQLLIGCFSAGSNLTGAVTNDVEVTKLLHEFGALAFWDYAAAAPHVKIDMNPMCKNIQFYGNDDVTMAFKDAIFFSGHKFLGGPQTPGVLVVKRHVLQNPIPHGVGGGTVLFTTKKGHHYLEEPQEKEEGGTPDIIGSIRLGLVFQLRNHFGIQNIVEMEAAICRQVLDKWSKIPEIHILGHNSNPRLPLISFMIEHLESGYYLHHNYVVALLNDLFGIQCRGGCMCAGPYAQDLLGIDEKLADLYEDSLRNNQNRIVGVVLKPGFVRISFNFHSSQMEVDFVIEAVKLIARHGWKLLPFYKIDWETSSFIFSGNRNHKSVTSLKSFNEILTSDDFKDNDTNAVRSLDNTYSMECLKHAKYLLLSCFQALPPILQEDAIHVKAFTKNKHLKKLRWFLLSSESIIFIRYSNISDLPKSLRPFQPIRFSNSELYENTAAYINTCYIDNTIDNITKQINCAWKKHRYVSPKEAMKVSKLKTCEFNPGKPGNDSSNDVSSGFEDDTVMYKY